MKILYPECGRIVTTHSCRGAVKIESFCDTPEILASLPTVYFKEKDSYLPMRLLSARVHSGAVIATIEGILTMEEAEKMRGTVLYARREDLPIKKGALLLAEVTGLPVIDAESSKMYGTVIRAERGAASDLYTVRTETGDRLLPAVPAFIREADPERGIFITPIPGLLEDT